MKALVCLSLVGCFSSSSDDVVGPFTGASHRFVVDGFALPISSTNARMMGGDLDGDGAVDNIAGSVIAALNGQNDVTTHAGDMIASGALASSVEILANDLVSDDHVGVLYFGIAADDPTPMGGRFVDGVLLSNRTRTTGAPGRAHIRLPVFRDADPVDITLEGMEIDLVPDGVGYLATIHGVIAETDAKETTLTGLLQMVATDPSHHLTIYRLFDATPYDGVLTLDEASSNDFFRSLLAPDLEMFDGNQFDPTVRDGVADSLSIGFQIHLSPCPAGSCQTAPAVDPCFDRIKNHDETDVDCGGATCRACSGGFHCTQDSDCETGGCDAGTCREADCSDGRRDGFESDIDCGGACAAVEAKACADGKHCEGSADCGDQSECDFTTKVCVPSI